MERLETSLRQREEAAGTEQGSLQTRLEQEIAGHEEAKVGRRFDGEKRRLQKKLDNIEEALTKRNEELTVLNQEIERLREGKSVKEQEKNVRLEVGFGGGGGGLEIMGRL